MEIQAKPVDAVKADVIGKRFQLLLKFQQAQIDAAGQKNGDREQRNHKTPDGSFHRVISHKQIPFMVNLSKPLFAAETAASSSWAA